MNGQLYRLMLLALAALLTAALLSGCAAPPPAPAATVPPPLSVPWTAARPHAADLLADADFYFPRDEKFIYGPQPLAQVSAYSELTFDAQPIGTKNNTGYRYRWVYRSAVTAP